MKTCTKCELPKTDDEFSCDASKSDGLCSSCKECQSEYWKQFAPTPEQIEQRRLALRKHGLKKYGLAVEQYDHMFVQQNGVCAICKNPETSSRAKLLAVDHNHTTGRVRELLCQRCNRVIGMFNDDVSLLQAALDYLVKHACLCG